MASSWSTPRRCTRVGGWAGGRGGGWGADVQVSRPCTCSSGWRAGLLLAAAAAVAGVFGQPPPRRSAAVGHASGALPARLLAARRGSSQQGLLLPPCQRRRQLPEPSPLAALALFCSRRHARHLVAGGGLHGQLRAHLEHQAGGAGGRGGRGEPHAGSCPLGAGCQGPLPPLLAAAIAPTRAVAAQPAPRRRSQVVDGGEGVHLEELSCGGYSHKVGPCWPRPPPSLPGCLAAWLALWRSGAGSRAALGKPPAQAAAGLLPNQGGEAGRRRGPPAPRQTPTPGAAFCACRRPCCTRCLPAARAHAPPRRSRRWTLTARTASWPPRGAPATPCGTSPLRGLPTASPRSPSATQSPSVSGRALLARRLGTRPGASAALWKRPVAGSRRSCGCAAPRACCCTADCTAARRRRAGVAAGRAGAAGHRRQGRAGDGVQCVGGAAGRRGLLLGPGG
jgi:hypothetical protein